ncbi:DUF58 domain-containing protein [Methyloligella solikamskensis]|uniref:DUF58 domain-containing protein n=1 Tax=Methyloligella solikamskensis TaxID=1177756 RepID=A0ABW3JB45_9HYPH
MAQKMAHTLPPEVTEAHSLADRMPALLLEAQRVAHTVTYGTHGRRRAGPGETFWQFRYFDENDSLSGIDWRRSAGSDHLYVREREWEAAHTVWLWTDLSPSMQFRSSLSGTYKDSRAAVLALALCELLIRAGERVGFLGHAPMTGRHATRRLAEILVRESQRGGSLPPAAPLNRFSECILLSDFLEPVADTAKAVEAIAAQGVRGHMIQVFDPAEETLPYEGRTEFTDAEGGDRVIAGRAENLREAYAERLQDHRDGLNALARRLGWSVFLHHTDRPAGEALLSIHNRLAGLEQSYQFRQPTARGSEPAS